MALAGRVLLIAGFYVGLPIEHFHDARRPRQHVAVAVGQRRLRRRSGRAVDLGVLNAAAGSAPGWASATRATARPAHTDLVLAAVGEELGTVGLLAVALVYGADGDARGSASGLRAANDYGFFLATAVTLFLIVPVLMMAAGVLGVTPLTGVVTPFLSYGGSAMVANFAALGMLMSIQANARRFSAAG